MNTIYERIDIASERRVQAMLDRVQFEDLYETAVEVFLREPPQITEVAPLTEEQKIVAACGVRGLAFALDGKRRDQFFTKAVETEDGYFETSTDAVVRYPLAHSAPVNPDIQQKIEALGSQLLNEAFLVLGTDVKPQIKRFRAAETAEEQKAVLDWLDERCGRIRDLNRTSPDPTEITYHPSQLSPKLIGQYPHHNLTPTCLGFGIITASFLRQCGATTLQAGVANTHYDTLRKHYYYAASRTHNDAAANGFASIEKASLEAAEWGIFDYKDIGFHVATYTQLIDGTWYCVDPNYRLSYQLDEFDTDMIQDAFEDLTEMSSLAKGVEIPVQLGHASASQSFVETLRIVRKLEIDTAPLAEILTDHDTESLPYKVFVEIAEQIGRMQGLSEETHINSVLNIMSVVDSEVIYEDAHIYGYWTEFTTALDRHVMHKMDVDEFIRLCREDPAFLQRRLEEIQMLPTLALQGLLAREMDDFRQGLTDQKNKHEFVEVGLPDYRIGCAVLSDLAVYTQAPLSPQFLLSYWPSRVPITETRATEHLDGAKTLDYNMAWSTHTDFYYPQQCGIIERHSSGKSADTEE